MFSTALTLPWDCCIMATIADIETVIARNASDFGQTAPSGVIRSRCDSSHNYKSTGARGISGLPLYPCSLLNDLDSVAGSIPTRYTPSKRMRLGTKSCVECRRRKVRCTFRVDESAYKAYIAYKANCVA